MKTPSEEHPARATDDSRLAASPSSQQREQLLAGFFPSGVPRLWCPTLSHFRSDGELDETRIRRHFDHLSPHVKGILVPGLTGEGWEMGDADTRRLLAVALDAAQRVGMRVLIGVLRYSIADMQRAIDDTVAWLKSRSAADTADQALSRSGVVGFTVCPPKGADLPQQAIRDSLAGILSMKLPTALYQLPQVTENEVTPQTVKELANRFSNLLFFKDSSGRDLVAQSSVDLDGVFLVRGAEGDYARVIRSGNGPYDGLLLSTANVFAAELDEILRLSEGGQLEKAKSLAARIERVVQQIFELVADVEAGNAFTNANKVLDQIMAYGPIATELEPPMLYSGVPLPAELVGNAVEYLRAAKLLPSNGYMNHSA